MTNRTLRILAVALIAICATLGIILYEWAQSTPGQEDTPPATPATAAPAPASSAPPDSASTPKASSETEARISAIEQAAQTQRIDPRLRQLVATFSRAAEQNRARRQDQEQPAQGSPAQHAPDAPVEPGDARVWDTDRDGIRGAIQASTAQIKECYDPWLALNPKLGGRVVANFVIDSSTENSGRATIRDVRLKEGGLGNQFLEGCLLSVLSSLAFHQPEGGGQITVNYPFVFSGKEPPAEP